MYVSLIVEMTERHSSFIYNQVSAEEPVRWTLPWGRMNSVSISSGTHWPTVTKTSWALLKLRLELHCTCCWIISKNHHESLITVSTRHTISRQDSSNVVRQQKMRVSLARQCELGCQFNTWMSPIPISLSVIETKKKQKGREKSPFYNVPRHRVGALLCYMFSKISRAWGPW